MCPKDMKTCPNGKSVGRDPKTCDFKPCPADAKIPTRDPPKPTSKPEPTKAPGLDIKFPKPTPLPAGYSYTDGDPIEVDYCVAAQQPCKILLGGADAEEAPFKFREFNTKAKCCPPFQCKTRDVAAISYYGPNPSEDVTLEQIGSIYYCSMEEGGPAP